ncbi:hypothetical protein ACIBI4_19375 [Streptomyces sp. NPDC050418]|uniref:hypothetical protein n=1 Tax=Streptomyces sp. NPDC050418 TaxID=3365612 RepID=UPI00379E7447
MGFKRYGSIAALGTALALLAGCGGTEDSAAGPLDKKQVQSVLPDGEAVPGWKVGLRDAAEPLPKISRAGVCGVAEEKKTACDGLRFYTQGSYTPPGAPYSVTVTVLAAEDADGAQPAYDFLWKRVSESVAKPQKLDAGDLGDERGAVRSDYGSRGGPVAHVQVRVGATVLQISGEAAADKKVDLDTLVDLAAVVSERAGQAAGGDTPSAALGD